MGEFVGSGNSNSSRKDECRPSIDIIKTVWVTSSLSFFYSLAMYVYTEGELLVC